MNKIIGEHIKQYKVNLDSHINYRMLSKIFGVPLTEITNLYNLDTDGRVNSDTILVTIYNDGKIIYTEYDDYLYSYEIYNYSDDWKLDIRCEYNLEVDMKRSGQYQVETKQSGGFYINRFEVIKCEGDNKIEIHIPELGMIMK